MIKVKYYYDDDFSIKGFCLKGHADYAEIGYDIVCSAVGGKLHAAFSLSAIQRDILFAQHFIYKASGRLGKISAQKPVQTLSFFSCCDNDLFHLALSPQVSGFRCFRRIAHRLPSFSDYTEIAMIV